MSLSNLVRSAKKGIVIGLASAAIYAGSLGLIQPTYAQNRADAFVQERTEITLPEKLTQEGDEFYKDPHKEFEFYRNTYRSLAKDGVIDSNDIESLEFVLNKTLGEINGKIYNQHGVLKDSIPSGIETKAYLKFLAVMQKDLDELRVHLRRKEKWSNTDAVQGKFWHYGSGLGFYSGHNDNGNTGMAVNFMLGHRGLPDIFIENPVYKTNDELLLGGEGFKSPTTPSLSDEIPAKTRFNYWLGLLGGLAIPGLSILGSSKLRKRKFDGGDIAYSIVNPALSWAVLDSIHPVVFPIRLLAFPAIYETARWIKSKVQTNSNGTGNATKTGNKENNPQNEKKESTQAEMPDLPTDFIDPWSVDLRGKEGGN